MRNKPLLIYDGGCGFCRFWIERWKKITKERIQYAPFQEVAGEFPDIPLERFQKSIQLILPSGKVLSGARAVFYVLASVPEKRWMLWAYTKIPGAALFLEFTYKFVAANRGFFSFITRLFFKGGEREK